MIISYSMVVDNNNLEQVYTKKTTYKGDCL